MNENKTAPKSSRINVFQRKLMQSTQKNARNPTIIPKITKKQKNTTKPEKTKRKENRRPSEKGRRREKEKEPSPHRSLSSEPPEVPGGKIITAIIPAGIWGSPRPACARLVLSSPRCLSCMCILKNLR